MWSIFKRLLFWKKETENQDEGNERDPLEKHLDWQERYSAKRIRNQFKSAGLRKRLVEFGRRLKEEGLE